MDPITFDRTCYRIAGQPVYLHSGEFHYFRVPRADWRARMRLFREAGGNCLATYIPWLLHEPQEGTFRFGGDVLDLEGFLQTAQEEGLYCIARPGPYQYSELKYDGLPGWLCEGYPELHAHDIQGRIFRQSSISYIHPLFLDKARRWFDRVCPILARYSAEHGGPVAQVQLDNELAGIHVWFGSLDYNAESMGFGREDGRYPRFLRARYGDISELNRLYGAAYVSFAEVRPILPAAGAHVPDLRRARDYYEFYLGTVAEYCVALSEMIRAHGINVPLVHNSANPGMNPCFREAVAALGNECFLLGSDHYYNLSATWPQNTPTPQYAVNAFSSLEMLRLMGYPPTVFELPGGSCSDWPPLAPEDLRVCYLANVALGMKGSNYYILTGGPNPPGAGVTTDLYDYSASIGAHNEIRPLYGVQKDLGLFLQARPWLMEAERECDCRLALDWDAARAAGYWQGRGEVTLAPPEAWEFTRSGMLTTALCASLSPAFVDLDSDGWLADLSTPLIVTASSVMARAYQERLVRFLQAGGRMLIAPVLPTLDERLEPCTVLADYLGAAPVQEDHGGYVRASFGSVINVLNNGAVYWSASLPAGAEVVGADEVSGRALAWEVRTRGEGQALFLGFRWLHAMREHERMLQSLLQRLGLVRKVACTNPNLWTSLRTTTGDRSLLFVLNLLSQPFAAEITCRPAWSEAPIDLGRVEVPAMTVKAIELGTG